MKLWSKPHNFLTDNWAPHKSGVLGIITAFTHLLEGQFFKFTVQWTNLSVLCFVCLLTWKGDNISWKALKKQGWVYFRSVRCQIYKNLHKISCCHSADRADKCPARVQPKTIPVFWDTVLFFGYNHMIIYNHMMLILLREIDEKEGFSVN